MRPDLIDRELSDRELEVLARIAAGRRGRQAARDLWISYATVKTHLYRVRQKLGVTTSREAVAIVRQRGLLTGEDGK